ncbi:hypothetical protein KY306_02650 [Candidatus Woesearchaeota archaeon]|nr:hypothetical protein [Candidatus Woesearchaeota archaeon]
MKLAKDLALKFILVISIAGVLFSGYLSYIELFQKICPAVAGTCPPPMLGLPVCVYGLFMYILVLVFSLLGLKAKK